jgi:hypothetical protein
LDGRSVVISTTVAADELNDNQAPEEAKLFIYDIAAGKKDVLVRIDPKDTRVHVVGKTDPVGFPTFVDSDM